MKITCANVPGGWQTLVTTNDGQEWPFGPAMNRIADLWDWQRKNLYDYVDGYTLNRAELNPVNEAA
jgi:hypothetical protein